MRAVFGVALLGILLLGPTLARAGAMPDAGDPCAALDAAYPEPGRAGLPGDNAFRPLPVLAPVRSGPGAAGTVSMSISVDHVSQLPAGKPGFVYVGNYPVTDIPAFRIAAGPATSFSVVRPETGDVRRMSDGCVAGPSWGFAGTEWALVQGDTLDVMLKSRLDYAGPDAIREPLNGAVPCQSSNLHTHGLLVSPYHPRRTGIGPYGDYVMDVTQPHGDPNWGTEVDTCGTNLGRIETHHGLTAQPLHYVDIIPGQPGVNSLLTGEHPSGLFWYHPHPHGFSKIQVGGGTTGAITIGSLTDYACPDGDGVPGHCTLTNTNIRTLELKETEIQSYGQGGLWSAIHIPESGYCSPSGGIRHGECQSSEGALPGKWVFTVNGVQYPTIHPLAGRTEIWRVVNASSGMSYVLSLDGAGRDIHTPQLPFQVLSKDGVSIRQDAHTPLMRTRILMLPSSRVEIAIPAPPGGGSYVLHNASVATGGHGSGDIWPNMDLARVVWEAPAKGGSPAATPIAVAGAGSAVAATATVVPDQGGIPRACRFAAGDTRVIYFVHQLHGSGSVNDAGELIGPHSLGAGEKFGLIAGIRHADGRMDFFNDAYPLLTLHSVRDVWKIGMAHAEGADAAFPAFMHNPWASICTEKGNVEPWELQNWTGEDHNFHIHQSRFTLDPAGAFQYPKPESLDSPSLSFGDRLVRDFADLRNVVYHDNVPVPRGQSFCAEDPTLPGCTQHGKNDNLECTGEPDAPRCANPGKMSVLMDFTRNEQVGSFVYHCHILEHEDGGMMAMIRVLCPPGDTSCLAQQIASGPICRAADPQAPAGDGAP